MGVLNKLSIGLKLGVAFSTLAFAGVATSLMIINSAKASETSTKAEFEVITNTLKLAASANEASMTMANEVSLYVITHSESHRLAKIAADEEAAKAFDDLVSGVKAIPNSDGLVKELKAASAHDLENCNPLEDKAIELVKQGKADEAVQLVGTKYAPARDKLESMIHTFNTHLLELQRKNRADAEKTQSAARFGTFMIAIFLGISSVLFAMKVMREMVTSIRRIHLALEKMQSHSVTALNDALARLADGDFRTNVELTIEDVPVHSEDEIGKMTVTFNQMVHQLRASGHALNTSCLRLGGIIQDVADRSSDVNASGARLTENVSATAASVQSVNGTLNEIAQTSEEAARSTELIAAGNEKLAVAMTEAKAITERILGKISEVAQTSGAQGEAAHTASQNATEGALAVEASIGSMERISSSVSDSARVVLELGARQERIGAIVETIGDIAEQTNLLALNAAIEAARAGEQGKGFAVVADEVRKLAERSSIATREIGELIDDVRIRVEEAVKAMDGTASEVKRGSEASDTAREALARIMESFEALDRLSRATQARITEMETEAVAMGSRVNEVANFSVTTAAGAEQMSASSRSSSEAMQRATQQFSSQERNLQEIGLMATNLRSLASELDNTVASFKFERRSPERLEKDRDELRRMAA